MQEQSGANLPWSVLWSVACLIFCIILWRSLWPIMMLNLKRNHSELWSIKEALSKISSSSDVTLAARPWLSNVNFHWKNTRNNLLNTHTHTNKYQTLFNLTVYYNIAYLPGCLYYLYFSFCILFAVSFLSFSCLNLCLLLYPFCCSAFPCCASFFFIICSVGICCKHC